jgi:hypothetical protein
MLFDLRSRGRRRTVQVIYIGLAVLIGSGLVLFGVGTGGGGGGLLGGLTGNGSSGGGNSVITSQTKKAVAQTKKSPGDASAWADLVAARFAAANTAGYDSATSTYTTTGRTQLNLLSYAYARYAKLVRSPSSNTATLAAEALSALGQYGAAASVYQTVLQSEPGNLKGLECVSLLSYAAGNDRVALLAEARVLAKVPKSVRKQTKSELESAKTTKATASESCG